MTSAESIDDDEIILRRLTNHPDNTRIRPGGRLTATSYGIRPRKHEKHSSCSRRRLTEPQALLRIEAKKGRDISGWKVAAVAVGDVRALDLDVIPDPTAEDPGHCLIVPAQGEEFEPKVWSMLAKQTDVVYTQPVAEDS